MVANLKPATSLLLLSRSSLTRRRTRIGPAIASSVGRATSRMSATHSGKFVRNIAGPFHPGAAEVHENDHSGAPPLRRPRGRAAVAALEFLQPAPRRLNAPAGDDDDLEDEQADHEGEHAANAKIAEQRDDDE